MNSNTPDEHKELAWEDHPNNPDNYPLELDDVVHLAQDFFESRAAALKEDLEEMAAWAEELKDSDVVKVEVGDGEV